jgi:hypothetical protein
MTLLLQNSIPTTVEMIWVSVPESLGLLIFGVLLVAVAVILRSVFAKAEKSKAEKETGSLAGEQNG